MKGKDVPKPIKSWSQAGLSKKVMDVLRKNDYEKPTPIQAQGIPVILSGELSNGSSIPVNLANDSVDTRGRVSKWPKWYGCELICAISEPLTYDKQTNKQTNNGTDI